MKKKWMWTLLLSLGLVLIWISTIAYFAKKEKYAVLGPAEEGVITEKIYTNGRVEAASRIDYFAPLNGVVENVSIKSGDRVESGQLLLSIRMEEIEEQLAMERMNRRLIEVEREHANKEYFQKYVQYQKEAHETDMEPLDLTEFDLQLKKSQLLIDSYERKLNQSKVTAGSGGVVREVLVSAGEATGQGARLITIEDHSSYFIKAQINEIDANKIKLGMEATVTADSFEGSIQGTVMEISPFATVSSGNSNDAVVEIVIQMGVKPDELRPGYSVSVEIEIPDITRLLVPLDAVWYSNDQAYVYKVANDHAVMTVVQTGKESDEQIEIVSGLESGERIVIEGVSGLKDGDKVSVK